MNNEISNIIKFDKKLHNLIINQFYYDLYENFEFFEEYIKIALEENDIKSAKNEIIFEIIEFVSKEYILQTLEVNNFQRKMFEDEYLSTFLPNDVYDKLVLMIWNEEEFDVDNIFNGNLRSNIYSILDDLGFDLNTEL